MIRLKLDNTKTVGIVGKCGCCGELEQRACTETVIDKRFLSKLCCILMHDNNNIKLKLLSSLLATYNNTADERYNIIRKHIEIIKKERDNGGV